MKLFYFLMTTLLQKLQKSYKYKKVKKDNVFVIRHEKPHLLICENKLQISPHK